MVEVSASPLFLLDTCAVSDAIKRPHGLVAQHLTSLLPGQAAISVVVEGELRYGIAQESASSIERRLNQLLRLVATLNLTADVARRYGVIRADLAQLGRPIGQNDLWIAAHALALGLTLVTDNEAEFRRVPGLRVVNWLRA